MKSCWQTGFDSVVTTRNNMQHWRQLQNLFNQGANREAIAIVESFQIQMDWESYCQQQFVQQFQVQEQRLAS
jgi:hypothetical protein